VLGHIAADEPRALEVEVVQAVDQADKGDHIRRAGLTLCLRPMIEEPECGRPRVEVNLVSSDDTGVVSRTIKHPDRCGGTAERRFNKAARQENPAGRPLGGTVVAEQSGSFAVFHKNARLREDFERFVDDLSRKGIAEHPHGWTERFNHGWGV
jgi:hypothetical protein